MLTWGDPSAWQAPMLGHGEWRSVTASVFPLASVNCSLVAAALTASVLVPAGVNVSAVLLLSLAHSNGGVREQGFARTMIPTYQTRLSQCPQWSKLSSANWCADHCCPEHC